MSLLAFPSTTAGRASAGASAISERVYAIYYLPFLEAKNLVEEGLGAQASTGDLRIEAEPPRGGGPGGPTGFLRVAADEPTHERIAGLLKKLDQPVPDRVLRVFLLQASKQASGIPDLPPGESRAVRDLQEVLPYRGFRTLQSGIIRSSRDGRLSLGSEFTLEFRFLGHRDADKPVVVERFTLRRQGPMPGEPGKIESRAVLETSFSIRRDETVVVGTSKLDGGDEALVVLVTAAQ